MSEKGEIHQGDGVADTTYAAPPRRSFMGRVGAHYKKWWWLHLIIFIIVTLVIALPVVYVGYPKIAQGDVNDATLEVTELALLSPTPNSVHANQTQVLGNKSIYHPNLDAFNATILMVGGMAPIASALVPATIANDGQVIVIDTELNLNADAMAQFSTVVLKNAQFQLNFAGYPGLKEGVLPKTTVDFNKTVTMKGLNALQGFEITNPRVILPALPDGTNMNGTVHVPNPSVLTVEMGNVTLEVSVNGTHIGQAFLNGFTLRPGANTITMNANVNQTYVLSLITGSNPAYKNGIIPIDIVGNKSVASVFNGQTIPYYTAALSSNTLSTTLNVTDALANAGLAGILTSGGGSS